MRNWVVSCVGIQTTYLMFFEKEPEVVVETVYVEKESVEIKQEEVPLTEAQV